MWTWQWVLHHDEMLHASSLHQAIILERIFWSILSIYYDGIYCILALVCDPHSLWFEIIIIIYVMWFDYRSSWNEQNILVIIILSITCSSCNIVLSAYVSFSMTLSSRNRIILCLLLLFMWWSVSNRN